MSTTKIVLANNRPVTVHDYMNTFNVSRPTATKMLRNDKADTRLKHYMVSHFYQMWDTYPRKFRPQLVSYEAKNCQTM